MFSEVLPHTHTHRHTFLYWWMGKYAFLGLRALTSTETQTLDFLHAKVLFFFKEFNRLFNSVWKSQAKSEDHPPNTSVRPFCGVQNYPTLYTPPLEKINFHLKDCWDKLLYITICLCLQLCTADRPKIKLKKKSITEEKLPREGRKTATFEQRPQSKVPQHRCVINVWRRITMWFRVTLFPDTMGLKGEKFNDCH